MRRKTCFVLFITLFLAVLSVSAQIVPPPVPPPPPPGLPIDGGILFLLLSGLFYGFKKLNR